MRGAATFMKPTRERLLKCANNLLLGRLFVTITCALKKLNCDITFPEIVISHTSRRSVVKLVAVDVFVR